MDLFHIVSEAEWERARPQGVYRPASLGKEGFIHLSESHQVIRTANRFFRGREDLVVLVIDRERLGSALRYEEGEPGEMFPHLYSELPVDAVIRVESLRPDDEGVFREAV